MRGASLEFTARLVRIGGIMYGVAVPAAVSRAFGIRGWVPVVGTVGRTASFRCSLAPKGGGRHWLMLNGEVRRTAGIQLGDRIVVRIARDHEPRDVATPEDLAVALREEGVLQAFEAITPGRRVHIVKWLEAAVYEETRDKRIARIVEIALGEHEKRLDREGRG